jgi:hypothetical protein
LRTPLFGVKQSFSETASLRLKVQTMLSLRTPFLGVKQSFSRDCFALLAVKKLLLLFRIGRVLLATLDYHLPGLRGFSGRVWSLFDRTKIMLLYLVRSGIRSHPTVRALCGE